ncbi:hypothetical protein IAQ61_006714 [Plenodomus lingam]|uniref:uncharacterized protein n=1 Tax=Leptosphaeria maculans TaxID=5022 RepID=UPI0033185ECC|nr:hypothetical protein IAQ61_006714 [Plenodomus lingam]
MDTWRLDLVRRSKKSKLRGVLAQFKMMCSGFIRKSWIPNASVRRAAAYETSRGELALLGVFVHGSFLCVLAPNVDLAKLIEVDAQKEVKEKVKEKKKERNPIPTVFQFNAETSASAARIDALNQSNILYQASQHPTSASLSMLHFRNPLISHYHHRHDH